MSLDTSDREVIENGTQVFVSSTLSAADMEDWVQSVAKISGQRVEWGYCAGRAVVYALGDIASVVRAMLDLREVHDTYFRKQLIMLEASHGGKESLNGMWSSVIELDKIFNRK